MAAKIFIILFVMGSVCYGLDGEDVGDVTGQAGIEDDVSTWNDGLISQTAIKPTLANDYDVLSVPISVPGNGNVTLSAKTFFQVFDLEDMTGGGAIVQGFYTIRDTLQILFKILILVHFVHKIWGTLTQW